MTPLDHAKTDVHEDIEVQYGRDVLTPRKRRVVEAYVRTGRMTLAAAQAGVNEQTAARWLKEDKAVRKAVGQMVDQAAAVSGITMERVLEEYARMAFSDIGELLDVMRLAKEDGAAAMEMLADLPANITSAISKLEFNQMPVKDANGNTIDITNKLVIHLHDKKGALDSLGKMLALFVDRVEVDDKSTYGQHLREALARIEASDAAKNKV